MSFGTTVNGCKFCDIAHHKPELHLKTSEKVVLIRDIKPKAAQHFLAISKMHINKPSDLTAADIPLLEEMERLGREYLRMELKSKGEADTVEDMFRVGFHWSSLLKVHHLHMHIIYPIKDLSLLSRMLTFRPGKVFKPTSEVILELKQKAGIILKTDEDKVVDEEEGLPAHAIVN